MKWNVFALAVAGFVSQAAAHYTFPGLIVGGVTAADWQYVRTTTNKYSHGPVQDVNSADIRCYTSGEGAVGGIANVTAGSTVGFRVDGGIQHPGPLMAYMAKAPSSVSGWAGDGNVWFKIFEQGATFTNGAISWASDNKTTVSFTIPKSLPSGQYLFRVEHIGLHSAGSTGGAQFYLSCAQINVSGGGSGSPSPLVSFPGAYKATDPGILFQLYWPVPTSYTIPGPAVWRG